VAFAVTYAQRDEGAACLRLVGELDMDTAPQLNDAIDRLATAGQRRFLLDLTELTFCDSTGIAAFIRGNNRVSADGGWLRVTGATGRVARVLDVTGLADVLGYDADPSHPLSPSDP
jgi:anti-sigma B factor antagonist